MLSKKENIWRFLNGEEYEYNPNPLRLSGGDNNVFRQLLLPVCERPLDESGYDAFGVHWTNVQPSPHYTAGQDPVITDVEHWQEQLRIPRVENMDWSGFAEAAATVDRENELAVALSLIGPFERMSCLTSFEDYLANACEYPNETKAMIEAIADYKVSLIKKAYEVGKPDIFFFHDDWGTSVSTFFSPDAWRKLFKPSIQRIVDTIRGYGMAAGLHSCGAIRPLIPDIVEMGITCWEGQKECNDMEEIARNFPTLRIIQFPEGKTKQELIESGWMKPWVMPKPYKEKPQFLWA